MIEACKRSLCVATEGGEGLSEGGIRIRGIVVERQGFGLEVHGFGEVDARSSGGCCDVG